MSAFFFFFLQLCSLGSVECGGRRDEKNLLIWRLEACILPFQKQFPTDDAVAWDCKSGFMLLLALVNSPW